MTNARAIARHPDIVEEAKRDARRNEDIPTKTAVLSQIAHEKEKRPWQEAEKKRQDVTGVIAIEKRIGELLPGPEEALRASLPGPGSPRKKRPEGITHGRAKSARATARHPEIVEQVKEEVRAGQPGCTGSQAPACGRLLVTVTIMKSAIALRAGACPTAGPSPPCPVDA